MSAIPPLCSLALAACVLAAGCDAPPPEKPVTQPPALEGRPPAAPARSPDAETETMVGQLLREIALDPVLRGAEIRVSVTPENVRLSGFVHNAAAKLRAAELAQEIGGTSNVDNRLIVRRTGTPQKPLGAIVFL